MKWLSLGFTVAILVAAAGFLWLTARQEKVGLGTPRGLQGRRAAAFVALLRLVRAILCNLRPHKSMGASSAVYSVHAIESAIARDLATFTTGC